MHHGFCRFKSSLPYANWMNWKELAIRELGRGGLQGAPGFLLMNELNSLKQEGRVPTGTGRRV